MGVLYSFWVEITLDGDKYKSFKTSEPSHNNRVPIVG